MADTKLTDDQVANLTTVLRNDNTHFEVKVQYVNTIKTGIKQHNVPETCIPQLFEGLRSASGSQHIALATAGFTALNHLFTRMSRQEPKYLAKEATRTLPLVIEKLGDSKDKPRALAMQSLNTLYAAAPADVERSIRNTAMASKNPRAKEASMQWILETHQQQGMPFRAYVPNLIDLLEDADGMVRDTAKTTVIELFKNAPGAAKSDLKRQLKNLKVRPAIEQAIVKALAPTGPRSVTPSEAAPAPPRPALSAPSSFAVSDRPVTPMEIPAESVEPQYVNTHRELDDIIKEMATHFEGKESEQNWMKREKGIVTLRRLVAGNGPADFSDTFIAGLKALLDGIIKAVTSLRTSLSKEGCSLVQEMATAFGPAMDPLVELLMQTFMKLAANTKKISSTMSNTAITVIVSKVTYTPRIMQHIWGAVQDKNVQPRTYAAGWLMTILKKEAHHKSHVEHTGGADMMEKCIKKALGDANPGVREKMRAFYWMFWSVWPARADAIMADLDPTAQKLLIKDPNNPNPGKKVEATVSARPGAGLSKSTNAVSKPSLRDTMMAQKKAAQAARNIPSRPGSAMSTFTTSSAHSSSTQLNTTTSKPLARHRTDTNTISVNAGGMSVAPMRPAKRRAEVARPATAGPYSVRDQPSSAEAHSPDEGKPTSSARQGGATTPKRPSSRTHISHASESNIISPTHVRPTGIPSPRASPARLRHSQTTIHTLSPTRATDDLTLVVPTLSSIQSASPRLESPHQATSPTPVHPAEFQSTPRSELPSRTLKVYEDPFTDDQPTPTSSLHTGPVLEERPINEDAANIQRPMQPPVSDDSEFLEKNGQNARLLDSGITKIKAKTLEVHGFRKLQSLIRDSKTVFTDQRFEALLVGLFQYLEDPLPDLSADKAQDVKAQILTTIKILLKKERRNFQPYVSRGLESLLQTRGGYDTRAHVVSGLELLADELVTLSNGSETTVVLTKRLQSCSDASIEGCRTLSMGLHVLKETLDKRPEYVPTHKELLQLTSLAGRCLESTDSGVRMDAVKFCVALHTRVGEAAFWEALAGIKDDPKSLITYYIVKKQREDSYS
ncbi:clasp N terminal domain-containing protein [Trichoderma chlorosporum]